MCKILIRGQAATASKGNSPPRFGVAFVVGKWGPVVNTDVDAEALPQCSGGQSRPVVVYYSISWAVNQIQTRHHHVACQAQGHVRPLHTCTVLCCEGKGGRTLFCVLLCPGSAARQSVPKGTDPIVFSLSANPSGSVGTEMQAAPGQLPSPTQTGFHAPS